MSAEFEKRNREEFLTIRNSFLTSARPVQSPEHLKGRQKTLQSLIDALNSPGRHAFIYGFRGVGKSSLAQTAAYQLQHSGRAPILLGCEKTSTFSQICRDIVRIAMDIAPLEEKQAKKLSLGASMGGYGGNVGVEKATEIKDFEIGTVNDAIAHFKYACEKISSRNGRRNRRV
jgi:Cdc6-like AAA superfamily ATPase